MASPMDHADNFMMMNRSIASDGMGGATTKWTEGVRFRCLLTLDSSMEARTAEKANVTSVFTGVVDKGFPIAFHDVFRRTSTGDYFRVTSNPKDNGSPEIASFSVVVFSAEKYDLQT